MLNTLRSYEGSYQFKVTSLEDYTNEEIMDSVFTELKDQYNYRPTTEKLWAEVRNENNKATRYQYLPLEDKLVEL